MTQQFVHDPKMNFRPASRPFALSILILCLGLPATKASTDLPVEAFATPPDITSVRLSPDGKKLAMLRRVSANGVFGKLISVLDIDARRLDDLGFANIETFRANWVRWANNDQLLLSAVFPAVRYGTPTTETRLLVIDVSTKEFRPVLSKIFLRQQNRVPQFQDQIIDMLRSDDDHILLEARLGSSLATKVLKVNVRNGNVNTEHRDKPNVYRWMTDGREQLRAAVWRKETEYRILHRPVDSNKWSTLWEFESFAEDQVWPMGFGKDPNTLYVSANHEGRSAIFTVDLTDPGLEKKLVFAHERYDADGSLVYSRKSGEVIGTRFSTDGGVTFWDEDYKQLQDRIDLSLPNTANTIYGLSDDENRYVLMANSDTDPGAYYVGNLANNQMMRVARRYAALDPQLMSEKSQIRYEARDGLEIEGFLTMPKSVETTPLPTIIFPHGGPISFDDGGFDYWTQFFASRGYAVLQMNFRGSAGYGHDFMASGLQSWGLAMQNDVEDGTRWLVKQGIADPDRICIVGGSYGGYAALMEAARNPELYKCAVSFAGVTDVAYLVSSSRNYANYEIVKEQIGSDSGELKQRSPLFLADQIDIPVLIAHGTDDRSVRVRHGRRMHRALEKSGKQVTYLEFEDGDHYLSNEAHRLEFFSAMDEFLRANLN